MSNPEIQHHTSISPWLGDNRFRTFTLPDTQIPAAGLSAGYVVGVDPDGVPMNTLDVSNTEDAVAILAHDVVDGADVTAVFCIGGDVRADSLSFPAGQTLDGNRSATALTHRETLRRAGIFAKDANAVLAAYDQGTAT